MKIMKKDIPLSENFHALSHRSAQNELPARLPYSPKTAAFSLLAILVFLLCEPAFAQAWAEKTKTVADEIVTGLRLLCYPIALGVGIWIVYGLWMGTKRFQDMVPWLVGVALLIALPDLVKLIPAS